MSSKGGRCGLATNVLWKPVPGSGVCIHDEEVEMCPSVLTDDRWQMIIIHPNLMTYLIHAALTIVSSWQ